MRFAPVASGFEELLPGVFRWAAYSPRHKVELTSHALLEGDNLTVFDPIGLREEARERLLAMAKTVRVMVTSENHWRATDEWRLNDLPAMALPGAGFRESNAPVVDGLEAFPLAGGPSGECVFYQRRRRLAFGGDAVVHLPGRGLEILPEQYCRDQATLARAVEVFCEEQMDYWFPAHGSPIGPDACRRIAAMLHGGT